MLSIKNLHALLQRNLGINLKLKQEKCDNGTNGAEKYFSFYRSRNENYEVTSGEIILDGEDLSELVLKKERTKVFPFFQYPVEIPVSVTNFIRTAINETRKATDRTKMLTKC
jgi:Fe-S cluster assembly ATP-binding protein